VFVSQIISVLKRDRAIVAFGLAGIATLAWIYLIYMDWGMRHMDLGMKMVIMPAMQHWTAWDLFLVFLMWAIMMVAMMLPSAAPMIETYARVACSRPNYRPHFVWIFTAGYLIVWTVFSAAATIAQITLQRVGAITPAASVSPVIGGVLLIMTGIYQVTPLKNACLTGCRSPIAFLMTQWRDGARGALAMGLRHGAFCLGCCSMLMVLLFVFGVMNLIWIAALSIFVLIEKLIPGGRLIARWSGITMLAAGLILVADHTF
jgi:predicted metal-binding membrane protein